MGSVGAHRSVIISRSAPSRLSELYTERTLQLSVHGSNGQSWLKGVEIGAMDAPVSMQPPRQP